MRAENAAGSNITIKVIIMVVTTVLLETWEVLVEALLVKTKKA